jgi:hypothetical protein
LRFGFAPRCSDPCGVRYGCSARLMTGEVSVFHEDSCNNSCLGVPLRRTNSSPWANYDTATYIPAEVQTRCDHALTDTPRVCGTIRF